jgi:hypothetical protein
MLVEVDWALLKDRWDERWREGLGLYVYLHPDRNWLLYIGKCDFSSTRQRLYGTHKERLFEDIRHEYGVERDELRTMHGRLILAKGFRRSSELLADVESLLIMRRRPFGNIQSTRRRISRPGLRVHCIGHWPFNRRRFHDIG